jgi:hypothetical protein
VDASAFGTISHSGWRNTTWLRERGRVAALATKLTLIHACTRRPARWPISIAVASGSNDAGCASRPVARGSVVLS